MVALSFILNNKVCFGQDKGAASIDNQLSQAEEFWNKGDRHNYYSKATAIADEIKVNSSKTNLNAPAAKLLESLVSKQADPVEVGTSDLATMQKLATYLASNDAAAKDERRLTVRLLCKYLGKVRKERIPNFKPKPVFENVGPMAGMSPNVIKDPGTKAKHEEAIRENEDNARQNSRQHELKGIEWAMHKKLKGYMLKTFKASDVSTTVFSQCMSEAQFDDQERKEIEEQLKNRK